MANFYSGLKESLSLAFAGILIVLFITGVNHVKDVNACNVISDKAGVQTKFEGGRCFAQVQTGIWVPVA